MATVRPAAAAPKKEIRVEIVGGGGSVPPGAAAMAAITAAPSVAATPASVPEAVAQPQTEADNDGNGTTEEATKKTRRTKLDRVQDLIQKARDILTAMDLGGGTLDGFLGSAIDEINSVKASGFKPPRKRRQLARIWLKPEFIAAASLDDTWKQPLTVVKVTDGGMVHASKPDGSPMILRRRDFSTKDPNASQETASA